jgi:two-component sensor histidine kinase
MRDPATLSYVGGRPSGVPSSDPDEAARLAILRSYGILDTAPEPAFDRIVELAQALFNAPIALISFVDRDRQWFKAHAGLDTPETAREHAFCSHAIRESGVMVVPDAAEDARFAENPYVTGDPRIRFYAGAPLLSPEGARLGTVCIISPEPRVELAPEDQRRLQALAAIAANELELRRKTAQATLFAREVDHRVRNTLHFVNRILEAQAARVENRQARKYLLDAVDRIASVEVVQRLLRHGSAVFDTDAHTYLLSLATSLQETLLAEADDRTISVHSADNLLISNDTMATLGMVVVELVTNAFKHGRGNIEVHARCADNVLLVSVADEGQGLASAFATSSFGDNVGLRLVATLALPDGVHVEASHPQRITVRLAV